MSACRMAAPAVAFCFDLIANPKKEKTAGAAILQAMKKTQPDTARSVGLRKSIQRKLELVGGF